MSAIYITHARTPQELKAEVVTDLHRRILSLNGQLQTVARSAAEKAKMARAINELEDMLDYWSKLQIEKTARRRSNLTASAAPEPSLAREAKPVFDA